MFKNDSPHKKYARISSEKRQKLINRVLEQGISVVKASKKLGIKISTAKLILKKYKETGVIFEKKMPNYRRKDLKEQQLDRSRADEGGNAMNASQITSMEKQMQNVEGEGEDCMERLPFVGIYWYWPVLYYQI